uniref:Uncharacterized protein n=1 Tax=Rhodocyclus tenuis TaxID=1066 RepID=A0A840GBV5_RHOTE|nr:hypothetical protein [Rhodocyclus tenuis]
MHCISLTKLRSLLPFRRYRTLTITSSADGGWFIPRIAE